MLEQAVMQTDESGGGASASCPHYCSVNTQTKKNELACQHNALSDVVSDVCDADFFSF